MNRNHRYAWAVNRRIRRHLPEGMPYPKVLDAANDVPGLEAGKAVAS
jgi:hypothetical protein